MRRRLNLRREYVVIHHQNGYAQMPLVTFTRQVLELEGAARTKALIKIRQLEQSFTLPLVKASPAFPRNASAFLKAPGLSPAKSPAPLAIPIPSPDFPEYPKSVPPSRQFEVITPQFLPTV